MTNNGKKPAKENHHYGRTAKRLMGYVASTYKLQFVVVCIAIIISAIAVVASPLFLQALIDDFIGPMAESCLLYTSLRHFVIKIYRQKADGAVCMDVKMRRSCTRFTVLPCARSAGRCV